MLKCLWNDEQGFIVSAELILVATILVIGLVVGMSEVQHAVVQELNDVGDAIGSVNQSYGYSGFSSKKSNGKLKSFFSGSRFNDTTDDCDNNQCDIACDPARPEQPKGHHHY
ncbi:MAG: hypothetical protein O2955_08475 [Planctomycetota bacterium]|nr:hypothetical protein [Planctomycetota bacterium]MDA1212539.1 hypothetical protein [Planctomycetota bacterium]